MSSSRHRKSRGLDRASAAIYPLIISVVIGILAGIGAFLFHELLAFWQEVLWPGANELVQAIDHAAWYHRVLVPLSASLLAGLTIWKIAPEVRGPGVPQVMKALAIEDGVIRHRVTVIKALLTSCLISSGASLGREGPIVQIGASMGSSLAQLLKLDPEKRRLSVVCGAAAGIAAAFQAPMAGTMFAVEILLFDMEVTALSNIVISAVTGTVVARSLLGPGAVLHPPDFFLGSHLELTIYLVLGLTSGLLSLAMIKGLSRLSCLFFPGKAIPAWNHPLAGGIVVAALTFLLPPVLGVGYEQVSQALHGNILLGAALLLLAGKLIATTVCIGSGMSGGIFAPSLFMGAMLGTIVAHVASALLPNLGIEPGHYALVGMGAVVCGTTLAPITAILTIFELTYSYDVILPLMVACVPSLLVVKLFHGLSVYETGLVAQGIEIEKGHDINRLKAMRVSDFMTMDHQTMAEDTPLPRILELMAESPFPHFIVLDGDGHLSGVLTLRDIRSRLVKHEARDENLTAADLMNRDVITIREDQTMYDLLDLFARYGFSFLPVVSRLHPKKVVGQIKRRDFVSNYKEFVLKSNTLAEMSG